MCPTEYFDLYKSGKPARDAENTGPGPEEPENPAAGPAAKSDPGSPPPAGAGIAGPALSGQQLGYTGAPARQSPVIRGLLGILKAIGYFLIYSGISFIFVFIFEIIWSGQIAKEIPNAGEAAQALENLVNANSMLLTTAIDLIFLAVTGLIFFVRRNDPLSRRQNLGLLNRVPPGRLALIFGIGLTSQYALTIPLGILEQLLPQRFTDSYEQTQSAYTAGGLPAYILAGVILAPIVEELLFRGLIATRLTRAMPSAAAVLISAAVFGAMHGTLIQGLYAGLLGILLGTVFFRENSLLSSIVLHFGFNAASLPAYILTQNEQLANSPTVNSLYGLLTLICIPAAVVLLIVYFILMKKPSRNPSGPEVNAWLMRE